MADTTKDIWNDDDGAEAPKKHRRLRGVLFFLLVLAAVLLVVLFAAYRDGTGFDALQRYFNYGTSEAVSGETLYTYDAASQNRFALLGDHLAVLSNTGLRILDQKNQEVWSANVSFSAPALDQGGGRVVAYDVGGTELYVADQKGELLHISTDEEEPLIAATLNDSGWLAVTSKKKNYKGWVSVYDESMELVFEFKSARRFVEDAYVTDDCAFLAAVTMGQEDSVFVSNVVIYDLTQEDPVADYSIPDGLVAAIGEQEGRLVTVSDTGLTLADTDGRVNASYSFGGSFLRGYDLDGDGFSALLLNRYQSGSVGKLVTLRADGAELAALDVNQEVLDLSAAGRYLAVLYADSLVIYNPELQVYASLQGTDFASGVLMRENGSALLLSAESAEIFLP